MDLSIVLPCYNEANRIGKLLQVLPVFDKQYKDKYEIIFVNDGSSDNTVEVISENPFIKSKLESGVAKIVSYEKNQGKGYALKTGVAAASGKFIVTMDSDMSYHPNEIIKWKKLLGNKFSDHQILVGSRQHPDSKVINEKPVKGVLLRKVMGHGFNFLVRAISQLEMNDTQSGFKLYPAEAAKKHFANLKSKGYVHDVELLLNLELEGYEIKEMPVECYNREGSKVSVARDSLKMLLQLKLISIRTYFRYHFVTPVQSLFQKKTDVAAGIKSRPPIFRLLFMVLILGSFIFMPYISKDYGQSGDEWIQNDYAHDLYNYFFKDDLRAITQNVGRPQFQDNIMFYSGGFEFLCSFVYTTLGTDEYMTRHFLNALFGWLIILFAGLIAKRVGGWRTAFLTVLFLLLSPRLFGDSMNNPKDIPFAAAYLLGLYYIMLLVKQIPRPSLNVIAGVTFSIAFAINTRVGGILLINYYVLFVGVYLIWEFLAKRLSMGKFFFSIKKMIIPSVIIIVVGFFGGLIFWPYALQSPLTNPFTALKEMTNFSVSVRLLFDGEMILSNSVPWNYIPIWIFKTSPEVILLGFVTAIVLIFLLVKKYDSFYLFLIVFGLFFPWAYAVYKDSSLYDGWRHFIFIFPLMTVMAALLFDYIFEISKGKVAVKIVLWLVILAGISLPLRFMIQNHPNEYVYFNDISGGIKSNYGKFETDYYMNSIKQDVDWFRENVLPTITSKKILATNCLHPVRWYLRNDTDKIKFEYARYGGREQKDWDYGIFYSRFMDPELMRRNYWPDPHSIYVVRADGVPLSNVTVRKDKSDYLAFQEMNNKNYPAAEEYFKKAIEYDPNNENLYSGLAQIYLSERRNREADSLLRIGLQRLPSSQNLLSTMANVQLSSGRVNEGLQYLQAILNDDPENMQVYETIIKVYQSIGDNSSAQLYYDRAMKIQEKYQALEKEKGK